METSYDVFQENQKKNSIVVNGINESIVEWNSLLRSVSQQGRKR